MNRRTTLLTAAVGVVALAACAIGGLFDPWQFFRAYLTCYLFIVGLPLGCMVLVMIYHLTGGGWGYLMRRLFESGMRTLPIMALLFLPIAAAVSYLYLWAQPDRVAADVELQKKTFYLNVPFFWGRMAASFALWMIIASLLSRWSRRQAETADARFATLLNGIAGPGLLVYGVTIHFAAVDWVMSLQPTFHSSIFGPLFASGQILSAFCLATIVLCSMVLRGELQTVISDKVLNDVGSLLFSFNVIWAYLVWFQFMLIWIADMQTDVVWYAPRFRGGWLWLTLVIVAVHFVVPFFLLLLRAVKQSPRASPSPPGFCSCSSCLCTGK